MRGEPKVHPASRTVSAPRVQTPIEEIPRVALADLLERAVPYERWRAPFDARLRLLTWLAGAALLAHFLFLLVLPGMLQWGHSAFFVWFGGTFRGLLAWMREHMTLLALINLTALGVYLALLWHTRNLHMGTLTWQRVAFGELAAGAVGTLPLVVTAAIIFINILWWIFVICLVIGFLSWLLSFQE